MAKLSHMPITKCTSLDMVAIIQAFQRSLHIKVLLCLQVKLEHAYLRIQVINLWFLELSVIQYIQHLMVSHHQTQELYPPHQFPQKAINQQLFHLICHAALIQVTQFKVHQFHPRPM